MVLRTRIEETSAPTAILVVEIPSIEAQSAQRHRLTQRCQGVIVESIAVLEASRPDLVNTKMNMAKKRVH